MLEFSGEEGHTIQIQGALGTSFVQGKHFPVICDFV